MQTSRLFISSHSSDRHIAELLQQKLAAKSIETRLDLHVLLDSGSWPETLIAQLENVQAVAVLIGPHGLSVPQKQVLGLTLERQAQQERVGCHFPVMPVLLPKADLATAFLFSDAWIDLRRDLTDEEGLRALGQAVEGKSKKRPPAVIVEHCPYSGLKPFREEDAAFFFGREAYVDQLVTAIQQQRVTVLLGPSGSGKTSLIQAGLLPRLRRHCHSTWPDIVCLSPGERPLAHLVASFAELPNAAHQITDILPTRDNKQAQQETLQDRLVDQILSRPTGTGRLLLVVDQFEELFTRTPATARKRFLDLLQAVMEHPSVSLLIALRSEYYGQLLSWDQELSQELASSVINVSPLTAAELKQAIVKPARLVTMAVEPRLVQRLTGEAQHLSLLQYALTELWQHHQDRLLNRSGFEQIGGFSGAIDYRAEKIFKRLSTVQQQKARQIFKELVMISERGDICRRRQVNLADLYTRVSLGLTGEKKVIHPATKAIVELFAQGGLLTLDKDKATGDETVEIASPLIIEHWSRLRAWLDQDREFSLWRRRLRPKLSAWEQTNRQDDRLLQGTALSQAQHWLVECRDTLNLAEQAFIQQSLARRRRRQTTRWIIGLAALAILLWGIVAITLQQAGVARTAIDQRDLAVTAQAQIALAQQEAEAGQATAEAGRQVAERKSQVALARQLATQARSILAEEDSNVARSMLLAIESLKRSPSLAGQQVLRNGLGQLPQPAAQLPHQDSVWATVFSPDGQWLATRSGHMARIWEVSTGQSKAQLEHEATVNDLVFSPNGRWLVTASLDKTAHLWEVATGREVARLRHEDRVWGVDFSSDGRWLATRGDQVVYAWRLSPDAAVPIGRSVMQSGNFDPDAPPIPKQLDGGRSVPETTITVIGRGMVRMQHDDNILAMSLSPDGRWLATASLDHTARVWKVATGREVKRLVHDDAVRALAFSPDGQLLVTGSTDHTARLWSLPPDGMDSTAADADWPGTKLVHPEEVYQVSFSPDGKWLVTTSTDNAVRVWLVGSAPEEEKVTAREVARMKHTDQVEAVTFSPDGRWLATASADQTARIWLATTGRELAQMAHADKVTDVAFGPNGRWLATASDDRSAQLWTASIGYEVAQTEHEDWVLDIAFSPDGRWVASRSGQTVKIWEAATGRDVTPLEHGRYVNAMAFSPDGRWLATGSYRTIIVWEVATGREVTRVSHGGLVRDLAFSPDTQRIAAAGVDKTVRVWDVTTGQEIAQMAHEGWVGSISFSPNGRWLASGSNDKTARVWEAATGHEVSRLEHEAVVNQVLFSPDGQWLATASADGTARIWLTTTVREIARFSHRGAVLGVIFSPDGRWLATRSKELVHIWDTASDQHMAQLEHDGIVESAHFSPDGQLLATASGDRTARVWQIPSGQEVAQLEHEYWVNAVDFSPNGRWLATASADRTARVWLLREEDLIAEVCARLPRNLTPQEWQQYLPDEPYRASCPNLSVARD